MILELADLRIHPGQEAAFAQAIQHGLKTVASKAQGFRSARVQQGIESPGRFLLMIEWDTLADHMTGFREGPLFPQWRAIVGPFFAQPPQVEHYEAVGEPVLPAAS